jgi:hypothetical protein
MKIAARAGEVRVGAIADCSVLQEGGAVFRGEHNMKIDLREGLRHEEDFGLVDPFGV